MNIIYVLRFLWERIIGPIKTFYYCGMFGLLLQLAIFKVANNFIPYSVVDKFYMLWTSTNYLAISLLIDVGITILCAAVLFIVVITSIAFILVYMYIMKRYRDEGMLHYIVTSLRAVLSHIARTCHASISVRSYIAWVKI